MSTENLERIKEQAARLSTPEKAQLATFLTEQLQQAQQQHPTDSSSTAEESVHAVRLKRMEWLKAHRAEYGGQYVVLDGTVLIATGRNYREAREKALAAGLPYAFVTYLSKLDEVAEWGGWS